MQLSLQRFGAMIRKETIQLLRDRRYIVLTLAVSLVQIFMYAYAANMSVLHLSMAVVDQSQDAHSRELVQALVNSQYFDWTMDLPSQADAGQACSDEAVQQMAVMPDEQGA